MWCGWDGTTEGLTLGVEVGSRLRLWFGLVWFAKFGLDGGWMGWGMNDIFALCMGQKEKNEVYEYGIGSFAAARLWLE